jgi:ABC-2 type transport system ATP-binding protein
VLAHAGATVAATDRDTVTVSGLAAERIVALLGEAAVPFSEVSAHRATLEEAYMELTRDAVEFRAAAASGPSGSGPSGSGGIPRESTAPGAAESPWTGHEEAAR